MKRKIELENAVFEGDTLKLLRDACADVNKDDFKGFSDHQIITGSVGVALTDPDKLASQKVVNITTLMDELRGLSVGDASKLADEIIPEKVVEEAVEEAVDTTPDEEATDG